MIGQIVGGILGGLMGMILTEPANDSDTSSAWIRPRFEISYITKDKDKNLLPRKIPDGADSLDFVAMISEGTGTFIIVLMSMMIMSKT